MDDIARLQAQIDDMKRLLDKAYNTEIPRTVRLTSPLTSTSWDGDPYSTTAKTLIDLSAVFSAPANIKSVSVVVSVRDGASAGTPDLYLILSPNDTAGSGVYWYASGRTNNYWYSAKHEVTCNADGDIYFQIAASGAGTFDVYLQVWDYTL